MGNKAAVRQASPEPAQTLLFQVMLSQPPPHCLIGLGVLGTEQLHQWVKKQEQPASCFWAQTKTPAEVRKNTLPTASNWAADKRLEPISHLR